MSRNSLTTIFQGRHIPTMKLLRTHAYRRRAAEAGHMKWGDEEWERCLNEAEVEVNLASRGFATKEELS